MFWVYDGGGSFGVSIGAHIRAESKCMWGPGRKVAPEAKFASDALETLQGFCRAPKMILLSWGMGSGCRTPNGHSHHDPKHKLAKKTQRRKQT